MADNSKKAPKEKKKQSFWKGVKQEWNKIQWPILERCKAGVEQDPVADGR